MLKPSALLCAAMLLYCTVFATPAKLKDCWKKQVHALQQNYLRLSYTEAQNNLYHSREPWMTYAAKSNGVVTINNDTYLKIDSTKSKNKVYVEKRQLTSTELLAIEPGDTTFAPVTKKDLADELFETMHYTPFLLIKWFHEHKSHVEEGDNGITTYRAVIDNSVVKLYINNTTGCADKVTTLMANDLYGDVLTTYHYSEYAAINELYIPHMVTIEKTNGKAIDTVTISNAGLTEKRAELLEKPAKFAWKEEAEKDNTCSSKKISSHINVVNIPNADAQILIVEFAYFMAVIDAPLSSENGELIIHEAQKIAGNKPIKYFAFGHHHPWYLGGVRPFIRQGVTVITVPEDKNYIQYLATAPHTLQPDSLQYHPAALVTKDINDSMTISDGSYAIKLYVIGKASSHTSDYLVVYFPEEKTLFEDDLISIRNDGTKQKAGARQAGLYNAVKDRHLDVGVIIQSWPATKYHYKNTISFDELRESVE